MTELHHFEVEVWKDDRWEHADICAGSADSAALLLGESIAVDFDLGNSRWRARNVATRAWYGTDQPRGFARLRSLAAQRESRDRENWHKKQVREAAESDGRQLSLDALYCMRNSTVMHDRSVPRGAHTYDSALLHVILPELIRRVGDLPTEGVATFPGFGNRQHELWQQCLKCGARALVSEGGPTPCCVDRKNGLIDDLGKLLGDKP